MALRPILAVAAALLLGACGGAAPGEVPEDFALRVEPETLTLAPGNVGEVTVTLERRGGFSLPVTVTLEGLPAGVSAEPLTLNDASGVLRLQVAQDAPATRVSLTVRGQSGALSAEASLELSVEEGPDNGDDNGDNDDPFALLVFIKTNGWEHDSIPAAVSAVRTLGAEHGFSVEVTDDGAAFNDEALANYAAVLFLLTSDDEESAEDVLNAAQKAAFERFIQNGGGYAGVHSASDTGYGWPWYQDLVGAYFDNHPTGELQFQEVTLVVEDPTHPSTRHLSETWTRTDEWYNFRRNPREAGVTVLLRIDTATFEGGTMGDDHPIAWYHAYDGGRAWYSALGHSAEHYSEPLLLEHLLGGILYAAGRAD